MWSCDDHYNQNQRKNNKILNMCFIYKTYVMWAPGLLEHAFEVNAHNVGR